MTTHPKPNLFDWATSELSQDAFLSWLINWADPKYQSVDPNLYHCAVQFVRSLLKGNNHLEIQTIKVKRQWKHIDVLVTINGNIIIVIEDKKLTSEHSNQLTRYAEEVKAKFGTAYIHKIYFKMHEQSNYDAVIKAEFLPYTRREMLSILNEYIALSSSERKNDIVVDFHLYLTNLENNIGKYLTVKLNDWDKWYCWQGFYTALQKEFNEGNWSHINNRSGGFIGYSWHWQYIPDPDKDYKFRFYLQLEREKFVVKVNINSEDKNICNEIRRKLQHIVIEEADQHHIPRKKYGRYGNYMGITLLFPTNQKKDQKKDIIDIIDPKSYLQTNSEGLLDLPATIQRLKKAMTLLDTVYERALKEI